MEIRIAIGYLCVIVFTKVFVSGSYCSNAPQHNESPSIEMCKSTSISVLSSSWVFLDSTGAPNYQSVSCSCELDFEFTGTLNIRYRSQGTENCGIEFRLDNNFWSCEESKATTYVTQSGNNITYYKVRTDIQEAPACLGLQPASGSLSVTCFPAQLYVPPSTTASGATTTTTASTSTSSTSVTTTPTATTTTTELTSTSTTTVTATPAVTTEAVTSTTKSSTTTSITSSATGDQPANSTGSSASSSTETSQRSGGGGATDTTDSTTPRVAQALEDNQTAAIAGAVVGAVLGLIVIVVIIVCIICFARRRKERKRKQEIIFGPHTVRYNSTTSGDDVQITENALYDGENPSAAVNQLFIGGIPPTPGAGDSDLPRFETTEDKPRYADIGASNATKSKDLADTDTAKFRKGSTDSDRVELKLDTDYSEIDTGISNPGYEPGYKPSYAVPYDSKLVASNHDDSNRPLSVSPYDYIDHEKLKEGEEIPSPKGDYVRIRDDTEDQTDNETDASKRLGSESSAGGRTASESGQDISSENTDATNTGYANDASGDYLAAMHMDYDQV